MPLKKYAKIAGFGFGKNILLQRHRNKEFNFVFPLCFRASVAITLVCKANNSYPVHLKKIPLF